MLRIILNPNNQVCSFSTWGHRTLGGESSTGLADLLSGGGANCPALVKALNEALASMGEKSGAAGGAPLVVHRAQRVPRKLNPRASAAWRRYAYLLPLRRATAFEDAEQKDLESAEEAGVCFGDLSAAASARLAQRVDASLSSLQGEALPYNAFAFKQLESATDTCTLFHASARLVWIGDDAGPTGGLEDSEKGGERKNGLVATKGEPSLLIELVGDRFLRRMVRCLVSTSVRLALLEEKAEGASSHHNTGAEDRAEIKENEIGVIMRAIVEEGDRSAAALPAPSLGLAFVGVGFEGI